MNLTFRFKANRFTLQALINGLQGRIDYQESCNLPEHEQLIQQQMQDKTYDLVKETADVLSDIQAELVFMKRECARATANFNALDPSKGYITYSVIATATQLRALHAALETCIDMSVDIVTDEYIGPFRPKSSLDNVNMVMSHDLYHQRSKEGVNALQVALDTAIMYGVLSQILGLNTAE